jgi:hypothetical protein
MRAPHWLTLQQSARQQSAQYVQRYNGGMRERRHHTSCAEQEASVRALFRLLAQEGPDTPIGHALGQLIVAELEALWVRVDSTKRLDGGQSVSGEARYKT